jgi:exopolysaccharide biosynthesis polyprenyl glycosylphosphotransferase
MLREKNSFLVRLEELLDLFLTVTSFVAAYFIKRDMLPVGLKGLATGPNYYMILLMVVIVWYTVFSLFYGYGSYRASSLGSIVKDVFQSVLIGFLFLTLAMYLFKIVDVSRSMLLIFISLDLFFLIGTKTLVYHFLKSIRGKGYNYRSVVVIGTKERAKDVLKAIWQRHGSGYRIIGCLDTDKSRVGQEVVPGINVIDTVDHLETVLRCKVVDELIFAMPVKLRANASRLVALAENMGVSVRIIPDWQLHALMYEPAIAKVHFENFLDIPTMALHMTSPGTGAVLFKNVFDYAVSAALLILTSPLFFLAALAIKLSSKGPVFYTQNRVSIHGRTFKLYKFRTMVENAESLLDRLKPLNESDGPVFKITNDPRIIPYIGTFLRKTGLDELPQLINVLKGEMSLIGPRPPIPSEVEKYEIWHRRRLSMKPGLSCTWQVAPRRNDISFEGWMRMDLDYIDNWSVWLDCKILFLTLRAVLFGTGR